MRLKYTGIVLIFVCLGSPLSGQAEVQDLYRRGASAQERGDFYTALELYRTALDANPSYLEPLQGTASCYFALGEYDEALNYIESARRYASENLELINLEGRILLGLGRFDEAQDRFAYVLQREPNNVHAQFGMAEREIADGKIQNAASRFREALRISPENRRALLSLVLLYDEIGNAAAAENYITQALYFYSNVAQVRWIASRHYRSQGEFPIAWEHARAAHELDPEFLDAGLLFSELSREKGESELALSVLESLLKYHRDSSLLWYQLGMAYRWLGRRDASLHAFSTALTMRSGNDAVRIALENTLLEATELEDERRKRYADYHVELAAEYESRNMIVKASQEYRRGLQINPYSETARLGLSEIWQRNGFVGQYQEELLLLQKEGYTSTSLTDDLEMIAPLLESSVSRRWKVEQFNIPRQEYKIGLFFLPESTFHPGIEEDLLAYMRDLVQGEESLSISVTREKVTGFAEAFRLARQYRTDYFLILGLNESERIITLQNRFYLSETGSLLSEWTVFRTGNHRLPEAFRRTVSDINSRLLPYGTLLERRFNQGLVDLGKVDGVKPEDRFIIVRAGGWRFPKDGFGFSYDESDVVGEFIVTAVDDLVCEGLVERRGFFDMVNQGDMLFQFIPDAQPEALPEEEVKDKGKSEVVSPEPLPLMPPDIYGIFLKLSD